MRVSLDVNALLGAAASLVLVLGGVAAGYAHFRRWIQSVVGQPVREAAAQLQTSNGTTVAGYVEQTATKIEQLQTTVGALTEQTSAARDLAMGAQALAKFTSERLDDHLRGHN